MPTLYEAHIADSLLEEGLGELFILRKKSEEKVEVGVFLIDAYCLGVRDAFFYEGSEAEVRKRIETHPSVTSQKPPEYARTFLEASITYARKLGFAPHRDYKKAARVLGGLKASGDLEGFTFGKDGKPFYIQSESHSEDDARRVIAKLTLVCGENGFDFVLKVDGSAELEGDDDALGDTVDRRIFLYEGWLDGLTPERKDLLAVGPSEAAKRCFLEFADQDQFAGDPLFQDPVWVGPDDPSDTFEALRLAAETVAETIPAYIQEDPAHIKLMVLSFLTLFANLHGKEDDYVEEQFAAMVSDGIIDETMVPFLHNLYDAKEMSAVLEAIVHPEPGLDIRPMSIEKIDDATGHCLLICLDSFDLNEAC